jgi:hypothetical protein
MSGREACRLCAREQAWVVGRKARLRKVGCSLCRMWKAKSGCCSRYIDRTGACGRAGGRRSRLGTRVVRYLLRMSKLMFVREVAGDARCGRGSGRGRGRGRGSSKRLKAILTRDDADLKVALDARHFQILRAQDLLQLCIQKSLRVGDHSPSSISLCLSIT